MKHGFTAITLLSVCLTLLSSQIPTDGGNASISGRVTGPSAQPLVGMEVRLFRPDLDLRARKVLLKSVTAVTTNDRGEYRFFGMPPGRYYVSAGSFPPTMDPLTTASLSGRLQAASVPSETSLYGTAFFPGTPEASAATPIDLKAGAEVTNVDLSLRAIRTFAIRGMFLNDAALPAGAQVAVFATLSNRDPDAAQQSDSGGFRIFNAANTLEFTGIPPGRYWVSVTVNAIAGPPPFTAPVRGTLTQEQSIALVRQMEDFMASAAVTRLRGSVAVDVTNADVEGFIIRCQPVGTLEGRIRVEGQTWDSLTGRERIRLSMNLPTFGMQMEQAGGLLTAAPVEARDDGAFRFATVVPGEDYRLDIAGLPEDVYVKAARFGSLDVLGKPFGIPAGSNDAFDIVLATNGGRIDGRTNPNAAILLVPQAMFQRVDLFRRATADASGKFFLRGIAPGAYTIFAFERQEDAYTAVDSAASLQLAGTPLQVIEGGNPAMQLAVSRP